jgi:Zn-finger nucleic acid-binding protein/predicted RNA-binding Zn-ribbon protein involved in translation (DUF1610 family)
MLSSLNCPNCGAAAPGPDATRCEYCRSALTAMSCPSCFGAMFVGMQFCPHCGVKGTRISGDATLVCPGCRGEMRSVQIGATLMFECGECASTWLDAAVFTHLCLTREERGRVAAMVGTKDTSVVPTAGAKVRYVHCARCKKLMNRENFGRRSGVIIDVCRGHGVWFERGELASVASFIDTGGLERARAQDEERRRKEREKLEKEFAESGRRAPRASPNTSSASADSFLAEALRKLLT